VVFTHHLFVVEATGLGSYERLARLLSGAGEDTLTLH
jgi:hypothetical protein